MIVGETFSRGNTRWTVLGIEADGRVFARSAHGNTAFVRTHFPPAGQQTPADSPVCICHAHGNGFQHDEENGLWVHSLCGKPTALHLEAMARRAGAWEP